jgi:hypothetical protein
VDCGWLSSIPEPSDKRSIVTEFSATDFGVQVAQQLRIPAADLGAEEFQILLRDSPEVPVGLGQD